MSLKNSINRLPSPHVTTKGGQGPSPHESGRLRLLPGRVAGPSYSSGKGTSAEVFAGGSYMVTHGSVRFLVRVMYMGCRMVRHAWVTHG